MVVGDDVAELQRQLNSLGFDAGNVDGIFGPDTLRGLLEFQANRGLAEDGLAGSEVVAELTLMARATTKHGREAVRGRQWLENLPTSMAGQRVYIDPFCRDEDEAEATWGAAVLLSSIVQSHGAAVFLSRSIDTAPAERVRAQRANRLGVDLTVSICTTKEEAGSVHFFASDRSRSTSGEAVAGRIAQRLGLPVSGRAIPILKNTRSTAIVVALPSFSATETTALAQGVIDIYSTDWARE